jgi:hypothetical protein
MPIASTVARIVELIKSSEYRSPCRNGTAFLPGSLIVEVGRLKKWELKTGKRVCFFTGIRDKMEVRFAGVAA